MFRKTVFATICLVIVTADCFNVGVKDCPFTELSCLSVSGTCAQADNCPPGTKVQTKGLCPQQQCYGVECCVSDSKPVVECRSRAGECVSRDTNCGNMVFKEATDCAKDQHCCIWIY